MTQAETLRTCPQGHFMDDANTYVYRNSRFCRTCRRERGRRAYVPRRQPRRNEEPGRRADLGDWRTCPQGHVMDAANTYVYGKYRSCLTCRRQRARAAYRGRDAGEQAQSADRPRRRRGMLGIAAIPTRRPVPQEDAPAPALTFDPADPFALSGPSGRRERLRQAERIAEARRMGMFGWDDE
jgi:hypothetical protein